MKQEINLNKDLYWFKKNYCHNDRARKQILKDFKVSVESFEELGLGQCINSYATGERKIEDSFMIFKVFDPKNNQAYFPVFSEKVARDMLSGSSISVPKKMTIFANESDISNHRLTKPSGSNTYVKQTEPNKELINLIVIARRFMIFGVQNPSPMNGPFKEIYDRLIASPDKNPKPQDIKSVNTSITNFITKNHNKIRFKSLNDFIEHIRNLPDCKPLKAINFDLIRTMLTTANQNIEPQF